MRLKAYVSKNLITRSALAEKLRCTPIAVSRYMDGSRRPDANVIDAINRVTNEMVTPLDMHGERLEWLKSNRPDCLINFEFEESEAVQ